MKPKTRTLRRFGWQAEGDEGQYVASCYHEQRCQQVRESRQRGTREQPQGKLRQEQSE